MKSNLKFILKVKVLHIITYIVCGMIFSTIFDYPTLFALPGVNGFMRDFSSTSTYIGPLVQIIRGLLFGVILLLLKDVFVGKKYGWLKL